jgi:hypothetical protein
LIYVFLFLYKQHRHFLTLIKKKKWDWCRHFLIARHNRKKNNFAIAAENDPPFKMKMDWADVI